MKELIGNQNIHGHAFTRLTREISLASFFGTMHYFSANAFHAVGAASHCTQPSTNQPSALPAATERTKGPKENDQVGG
jgi:hypothetical protein